MRKVRVSVEEYEYTGLDAEGQPVFRTDNKVRGPSHILGRARGVLQTLVEMEKHLSCSCRVCPVLAVCPGRQVRRQCDCVCPNAYEAAECTGPHPIFHAQPRPSPTTAR